MGCHTWFFRPIKVGEKAGDCCVYSNEKFDDNRYTNSDTPHNLFRIGGYPEDYLLSLEDTLAFIEKYKESISK